jgi:zinc/manganese transport system permease protein
MIQQLQFILVPLLASIAILTLTSYLGIHVLKREIIFIDIALAQIAVMGGVVATYLEQPLLSYTFSLLFCAGASLIFTFLKNPRIDVPIEAFIGIAYAVATTAAVIILDKGAGGEVHLHDMLTGVLLWTTGPEVWRVSLILLSIGLFHLLFRGKFIPLSEYHQTRNTPISNYRIWDFFFYTSFGLVIIESVRIAGVLTVFAFLILPASISAYYSSRWDRRILIGLGAGVIATVTGLLLSISLDLTASPLIILLLGLFLLISMVTRQPRARLGKAVPDREKGE